MEQAAPDGGSPAGAHAVASLEELVGVLGKAAEIEHGLMCCYLYAAFALKTRPEDGLELDELAAVQRWRGLILSVALEEMAHLALVANLTCALGVRPHLDRPNFPVAPGYHPAKITVALAPFDRETLDHFIFLEAPLGAKERDAAAFAAEVRYHRGDQGARLTPVARDYETVGDLYRTIENGLIALCARHGEQIVFCGGRHGQLGPDMMALPGMIYVDDLASACRAIAAIVEQGEGAADHNEDSHYARFLRIRDEYQQILARNPGFAPSRPVARNPVMRRPPLPEDRAFVDMLAAARLLDLGNALYNQMLRCLVQAYGRADDDVAAKGALMDSATGLMRLMTPVAEALTTFPASDDHPGVNAGMSFATMRSHQPFVERDSEWRLIPARTRELAEGARAVGDLLADADALGARLDALADYLAARDVRAPSLTQGARQASAQAAPGAFPMAETDPFVAVQGAAAAETSVETARGEAVTLLVDSKRCIHARHCVLGAPDVFKANTSGEWLFPDAADVETIVRIAHACPSGAIRYERHDGHPDERPPRINTVATRQNGPLSVRGDIFIGGEPAGFRRTLCRCGLSGNKPFCDGSHVEGGFEASGEPRTGDVTELVSRDGPLAIDPQPNGPLAASGNLEVCAGTGRALARTTSTRLCRCGHSGNKPFCDGSHLRVGFKAP